ncbi:high choriolytic enzyme 1-like [Melanotaenia boesemani]|uniref:high choriolytic enzyme 1-like n=1 Tax=Melanotaenia boesemani TaxID=1250792 RepID=UPI001C0529E5|nr:high choriolytic enzyme 1-like [Melanotaenia boesemani]
MSPSASLLLLLLLGLSQAKFLPDDQSHQQEENEEDEADNKAVLLKDVDMTTKILTTNNGTNILLMEGDIVAPKTRNAIKCWSNSCFWRKDSYGNVVVPYVVSDEYSDYEKPTIENAMRGFGQTCVTFVPRTDEYDYVSIESLQGCYSELGRKGGMQQVSINRDGCMYSGIIQHELNHALGFQHEQTRSDRDNYVIINWGNIIPDDAYNFDKQDTNNQNTPYDYGSIMHYGRTAFAIAYGVDTITPIPNPNVQIGQRQALSYWDVQRINLLYQC